MQRNCKCLSFKKHLYASCSNQIFTILDFHDIYHTLYFYFIMLKLPSSPEFNRCSPKSHPNNLEKNITFHGKCDEK